MDEEKNKIDTIHAAALADLSVSIADLYNLKNIAADATEAAIKWIVASCNLAALAIEIEQAANQIYKLVNAVKKFTFMDNLAETGCQEKDSDHKDQRMERP